MLKVLLVSNAIAVSLLLSACSPNGQSELDFVEPQSVDLSRADRRVHFSSAARAAEPLLIHIPFNEFEIDKAYFASIVTGADIQYGADGESSFPTGCRTPEYAVTDAVQIENNQIKFPATEVGCLTIKFSKPTGKILKVAIYDGYARTVASLQKDLLSVLSDQTRPEDLAQWLEEKARILGQEVVVQTSEISDQVLEVSPAASNQTLGAIKMYLSSPQERDRGLKTFFENFAEGVNKPIKGNILSERTTEAARRAYNRQSATYNPENNTPQPVPGLDYFSGTKYEIYWGYSPSETTMLNILFSHISGIGTKENLAGVSAEDKNQLFQNPTDPFTPIFVKKNPVLDVLQPLNRNYGIGLIFNTGNPADPLYYESVLQRSQASSGIMVDEWLDFYGFQLDRGLETNRIYQFGPSEEIEIERRHSATPTGTLINLPVVLNPNQHLEQRNEYVGLVNYPTVQEAMFQREMFIQRFQSLLLSDSESREQVYFRKLKTLVDRISPICEEGSSNVNFELPKTAFGDSLGLIIRETDCDRNQVNRMQNIAYWLNGNMQDFIRLKIYSDGSATLMFLKSANLVGSENIDRRQFGVTSFAPLSEFLLLSLAERGFFDPRNDLSVMIGGQTRRGTFDAQGNGATGRWVTAEQLYLLQQDLLEVQYHRALVETGQPLVFKTNAAQQIAARLNAESNANQMGFYSAEMLNMDEVAVGRDQIGYFEKDVNNLWRWKVLKRKILHCPENNGERPSCHLSGVWPQTSRDRQVRDVGGNYLQYGESLVQVFSGDSVSCEHLLGEYLPNGDIECPQLPSQSYNILSSNWQYILNGNLQESASSYEFADPEVVADIRFQEFEDLLASPEVLPGSLRRRSLMAAKDYLNIALNLALTQLHDLRTEEPGEYLPWNRLFLPTSNLSLFGSNRYVTRAMDSLYGHEFWWTRFNLAPVGHDQVSGYKSYLPYVLFGGSPTGDFECSNDLFRSVDESFSCREGGVYQDTDYQWYHGDVCSIPFEVNAAHFVTRAIQPIHAMPSEFSAEPGTRSAAFVPDVDYRFKLEGRYGEVGFSTLGLRYPADQDIESLDFHIINWGEYWDDLTFGRGRANTHVNQMQLIGSSFSYSPTLDRQAWVQFQLPQDRPSISGVQNLIDTRLKLSRVHWEIAAVYHAAEPGVPEDVPVCPGNDDDDDDDDAPSGRPNPVPGSDPYSPPGGGGSGGPMRRFVCDPNGQCYIPVEPGGNGPTPDPEQPGGWTPIGPTPNPDPNQPVPRYPRYCGPLGCFRFVPSNGGGWIPIPVGRGENECPDGYTNVEVPCLNGDGSSGRHSFCVCNGDEPGQPIDECASQGEACTLDPNPPEGSPNAPICVCLGGSCAGGPGGISNPAGPMMCPQPGGGGGPGYCPPPPSDGAEGQCGGGGQFCPDGKIFIPAIEPGGAGSCCRPDDFEEDGVACTPVPCSPRPNGPNSCPGVGPGDSTPTFCRGGGCFACVGPLGPHVPGTEGACAAACSDNQCCIVRPGRAPECVDQCPIGFVFIDGLCLPPDSAPNNPNPFPTDGPGHADPY